MIYFIINFTRNNHTITNFLKFNCFRKEKHLKELATAGGMEKNYGILISNLKRLSEDFENKFQMNYELLKQNVYTVMMDFSTRKDMLVHSADAFILSHEKDGLTVEWKRYSNTLFGPSLIPDKITLTMKFDHVESQDEIFKTILIAVIENLERQFNFTDRHYEDVLENGHTKYVSKEEKLQREREMNKFLNEQSH